MGLQKWGAILYWLIRKVRMAAASQQCTQVLIKEYNTCFPKLRERSQTRCLNQYKICKIQIFGVEIVGERSNLKPYPQVTVAIQP